MTHVRGTQKCGIINLHMSEKGIIAIQGTQSYLGYKCVNAIKMSK